MTVLARKTKRSLLLKADLIIGILIMAAAVVVLPVGVLMEDPALMANPYVLGVVLAGMLIFGAIGYFSFLRPYRLYQKFPEVQAKTDGEYLYLHTTKKVKIPLSAMEGAYLHVELPFLMSNEFLKDLVIHLLSEEYGTIYIETAKHGKYKLRFIANAHEVKDRIIAICEEGR